MPDEKLTRGEELRRKFAAKGASIAASMNSPRGQFGQALARFTEKQFGIFVQESAFVDMMFAQYEAAGSPDLNGWLHEATRGMFASRTKPPRWVSEPRWCFHEGIPLTFVEQFTHPDGPEFYVFEGERDVVIGPRRVRGRAAFYKMMAQDEEAQIIFEGVIESPV